MTISRFLLISIFLIFSQSLLAEKVEKIDINGLNSISRGTVLNIITIEAGENINKESLDRSYKTLISSNLFSSVDIFLENNILKINLIENPTIKYVEFKGYKEDDILSEKIIKDIKKNFNLEIGQILVRENLKKLLTALTNLYQANAYYSSKIKIKTPTDDKNRVGVEIEIQENERALIGSFSIRGNSYFETDDLIDLFEIGEPDFFLFNYFTEKDFFEKSKFDAGIQNIVNKYNSEGFLDFDFLKTNVNYDESSNKLLIEILVSEGKQYKVGEILFKGNLLNFSDEYLRSKIQFSRGDIFRRASMIKDITLLKNIFEDSGYAFVVIDSQTKLNGDFVDVIIDINSDSRVYVSRIDISGNTRTQDDVIRRKINLLEGQIYSKSELIDSINRIRRLGFFSEVDYEIKRRVNQPDLTDIFITVSETKTGEFTIGLSHSNASGAAVNAGVSQKNIFGTGNTLNAAVSNSSAVKELSFYFKDPYFNNNGHSASIGFFDKTIDASNLDASSYNIDEFGFIFGYGFPLSSLSDLFGEIKTSTIDLTCGTELKELYEISQCAKKDNFNSNISLTYSSNSLNDSFFPTKGSFTSLKGILAFPVSDYKYFKIESNQRNYIPILDNKTFKIASRLNYASGYGGNDLPFYERYFEGGSSSVRGFDFNSLGAKYANDKPKGGEFSFISTFGVASPASIVGIDNENIRLIAFIDAGAISENISSLEADDFRSSTGVQLSWLTPIGPIGIHYARPILKKSGDKIESLSFELGAKF